MYDENGTELAKFKDLIYAYKAAISPRGDIFVVKSTDGRLAVYSLEARSLIKKFRFSKVNGAQDDNFCFSPDGERFYNIERHNTSCETAISIYRTGDFSLEMRLFPDDPNTVFSAIECDDVTNSYYILGFIRPSSENPEPKHYAAKLGDEGLKDIEYISENEYHYYDGYKALERDGFIGKAKGHLPGLEPEGDDPEELDSRKHSLAKLWNYYHTVRNS